MKRFILLALFFLLIVPASASAEWKGGMPVRGAGNFGLGFGQGTFANGLSLKYFSASDFAIQGNVGFYRNWGGYDYYGDDYYYGRSSIALSIDAIFEQAALAGNQNVELAWNFGIGGGLGLREGRNESVVAAAVAGILGLELLINAIPIDIVLEWRPQAVITPAVRFNVVHFSGHIRYYF